MATKCYVNTSKKEALAKVISSIASEEAALANLMQAESDKVCFAVRNTNTRNPEDMEKLARINESVEGIMARSVEMECLLKEKLRLVLKHVSKPCTPSYPAIPNYDHCKEFNKLPFPTDDFFPPQKPDVREKRRIVKIQ